MQRVHHQFMISDIQAGAQALQLPLSEQQAQALAQYAQLILKWNRVYNLTAIRNPQEVLTHHLFDCMAVVQPLERALRTMDQGQALHVMDVGAGAGLPSVVLAIMWANAFPTLCITAVDTVGKKAAFINQAAAELGLKQLRAEHARVEQLSVTTHAADLITSRAFASLVDFVTLTQPLVKPHGCWAALKGKTPDDEIAVLPTFASVIQTEPIRVPQLDAQRCIVWMKPSA